MDALRDRSHELESETELDILDEPEVEEPEPWEDLEEAQEAAMSRKRSMNRTSKPGSTRVVEPEAKRSKSSSTTVHVSPHQRVKEFPGEFLVVSSGKLFCDVCHHEVRMKKSIVEKHIGSKTHQNGKEMRKEEVLRQQRLVQSWTSYQSRHADKLSGTGLSATMPIEESMRRISVVTEFLKAGVPLTKINALRSLLEEGSQRLTHASHMASYVPFVLETEQNSIKEDLKGYPHVTVVFDGSTYMGEALVIILRFTTPEFVICQRLVRLHVLTKSLNGQQLARELVTVLSTQLQYPAERVIAVARDGASVNKAAVRHLKDVMYPNLADIICMSHSLDNVGKRMDTPVLDSFLQLWISLFAHSPAAKSAWRNVMGQSIKSYSATRWWSWWEVVQQLHNTFAGVPQFLRDLEAAHATRQGLLRIIDDGNSHNALRMQIAITVDTGKLFVEKTYTLEGDGELITSAYAHLQEISTEAALENYPQATAAAQEIAGGNAQQEEHLIAQARECIRPAIQYFRQRFNHCNGDLFQVVRLFKVLRIVCPVQARQIDVGLEQVDALRVLPCLDEDDVITALQEELPAYLVAAADAVIDKERTRLMWWKQQTKLPTWQHVAKIIFALLPSSAPAERVFSLLQASFNDLQGTILADQVEASLMLQYNRSRSGSE